MGRKQTKGRQKIEMKKIENENDRYASFSKRRNGIFKKASELCTLCKTDVGIVIFSPTGKPHSFFHPNVDKVVNKFLKRDQPSNYTDQLVEAFAQSRIDQMNQKLDELELQKEIEEKRAKKLDELSAPNDRFDWLGMPIEEMSREKLTSLKTWITNMLAQLDDHKKDLENEASSSNLPPQNFTS